jgi:hypothetical protein
MNLLSADAGELASALFFVIAACPQSFRVFRKIPDKRE